MEGIMIDINAGMTARICKGADASAATISALAAQADQIAAVGATLVDVLMRGGRVLTAGNGGSAAEAMHMAEELVGRYRGNRRSLPGIALTADGTAMTCIGNDFGFEHVFSRQVEGLASPGDMLVLFSTSGNATNLVEAATMAASRDVQVACILGRDGGSLAGMSPFEICVPGDDTARIQEAHQVIVHLLLEEVELAFPA
jgi:phosphoheptose isomerase